MMTRKFGETAPKTANFEASEERFEVPDLQESKRLLLMLASTPLKGPFFYLSSGPQFLSLNPLV